MKPVIALVGRPNVGKSTLFNLLTVSRDALVDDRPGVTRDRLYGEGKIGDRPYLVVDTGGLGNPDDAMDRLITQQVDQVLSEAAVVLLVVDGRDGLAPLDEVIVGRLRTADCAVWLVVNKAEGQPAATVAADFARLGLPATRAISARRGDGVAALMAAVLAGLPSVGRQPADDGAPRIAIVGRPNVGKSTLVNRLAGGERVIAYDQPGTTRDAVRVPVDRHGRRFILLDTAGVRRRTRIDDSLEKFSVIKTLRAIDAAQVAVLLMDASETVTDQDAAIAALVLDSGRSVVLAVNKWDGLAESRREQVRRDLDRRMAFLAYAERRFISARHGTGVGELLDAALRAHRSAMVEMPTAELNRHLQNALRASAPPAPGGRPIKLKFAHQHGHNPPVVRIHGNQVAAVPRHYLRYLENYLRKAYRLSGTPLRVELRQSENPFLGRLRPARPARSRRR